MRFAEAEGKSLKTARDPALDHVRIHPREDGGYVVAHVYDDNSDEDHHHFDSHDEMIQHVAKVTHPQGFADEFGRGGQEPGSAQNVSGRG